MGNTIRKCFSECYGSSDAEQDHTIAPGGAVVYQASPLGPHGVTVDTVGFAALARDLFQFEVTGQVPEGLSKYVQSSTAAQANWYRKLLAAWKASQPPPSNAEEASEIVLHTLHGHRKIDVQGLLSFYGLPPIQSTVAVPPAVTVPAPAALYPEVAIAAVPWPTGVQYELHTLPVDSKGVSDGDSLVVYVDTSKNLREAAAVPHAVHEAAEKRRIARIQRNFKTADSLQKEILNVGYKVIDGKDGNDDILAHKYRVRLRGVDAPESKMSYGQEAKAILLSLVEGHPLHLLVYTVDRYGRIVADVHCKKGFIQEILLKNGSVWHYATYDHRPEFAKWEKEARIARRGLWAENNPQKPWEYRKEIREAG